MMSPFVRGLVAALFVIALCLGVWWLWTGGSSPATMGEAPTAELDRLEKNGVPVVQLPRLDGTVFDLAHVQNKIIIVNFWASWCDPCVREFPSMLRLVERMKGDVLLVAISADESQADVEKFLKVFGGKAGPGVEIVRDPEYKVAEQFGTRKLPESYILDRQHKLVRKVVGLENWASPDVVSFFTELVQKKSLSK